MGPVGLPHLKAQLTHLQQGWDVTSMGQTLPLAVFAPPSLMSSHSLGTPATQVLGSLD